MEDAINEIRKVLESATGYESRSLSQLIAGRLLDAGLLMVSKKTEGKMPVISSED